MEGITKHQNATTFIWKHSASLQEKPCYSLWRLYIWLKTCHIFCRLWGYDFSLYRLFTSPPSCTLVLHSLLYRVSLNTGFLQGSVLIELDKSVIIPSIHIHSSTDVLKSLVLLTSLVHLSWCL